MNKLIDMHFHLDFYSNHSEVYTKINQLQQHTLCVTNQPEIFETCIDLYSLTLYVQFAIGFHPQNVGKVPFNKRSFIKNMHKTKYVGEVGLDYSKEYFSFSEEQRNSFNYICEHSVDKVMTVHCRKAEEDIYNTIKRHGNTKVVMHWYSGNEYWLSKLSELGCYFSVNANMLNSINGKKIIKSIPLERLFVESDGPFTKIFNKKYTIDKLEAAYRQIAQERDIAYEMLASQTTKNFFSLVK